MNSVAVNIFFLCRLLFTLYTLSIAGSHKSLCFLLFIFFIFYFLNYSHPSGGEVEMTLKGNFFFGCN
jgi:hypothetical protein